jgi:hypothetical protein
MLFDVDFKKFYIIPKISTYKIHEYKHQFTHITFQWGYLILVFKSYDNKKTKNS